MNERGQSEKLKRERCAKSAEWRWIYRLGSLRLAMLLLFSVAVACAVATICESKFNRQVAEVYIYKNPFFMLWLLFLCLNLICSALTRWPWERKHVGFVVTHGGIIVMLIGAVIGHFFGFEASVNLEKGAQPVSKLIVNQTMLMVQGMRSGEFYQAPITMNVRKPTPQKPRVMPVPESDYKLQILDYSEYLSTRSVVKPDEGGVPGVSLSLNSAQMKQNLPVSLLMSPQESAVFDMFGLAQVRLVPSLTIKIAPSKLPLLLLAPNKDGGLDYKLLHEGRPAVSGEVMAGEGFATGWLDWYVRVEAVYPKAHFAQEVVAVENPSPQQQTVAGIQARLVDTDGKAGNPEWIAAGTSRLLQINQKVIQIGFGLRQIPIPFSVTLDNFRVPRDEGTDQPANFISDLTFVGIDGEVKQGRAEMNHPASFPGGWWRLMTGLNYKFSQAGWDPANLNQTTLQVLYDPGWLFKWIGSLLICSGIVLMFYFRPQRSTEERKTAEKI